MANVAFIGLGVMGFPMAGHLVKAGHRVKVWNRTTTKAKLWGETYSGTVHTDLKSAVKGCEYVMLCVGQDEDVYAVVDPILDVLDPGAIIVDHTTASAECARNCAQNAELKGISFIDAPISGGEAGAINGQLTIMCGGNPQAYASAEGIMSAYAKATKLMGTSGAGQLTKMVNQICIAGVLQGLAEGVYFAQQNGLDIGEVVEAIGKGAAQSWQMDNRAITMGRGEYEFGFAVDWMRKDLGIALEAADAIGIELSMARKVDQYYAEVQNMGGGRWDTSSLLKRLQVHG